MSNYLVIFTGADASGGAAPVSSGLSEVKAGHRVVNIIGLNVTGDRTNDFSRIATVDGELIQDNGLNWNSYSFIALMERP